MVKPKRINPRQNNPFEKSKAKIESISELVKFSFKYLTDENPKFLYNEHDGIYFLKLIERLKSISTMKISEFRQGGSKSLRAHPIDWQKTSEDGFGLPDENQLAEEAYQFALSSNEYGRVHGFLIQNRFYTVWLDKDHKLYSGR